MTQTVRVADFDLTLRNVVAGDSMAVLALHAEVFGTDADQRWFDWKYGPASSQGRGQAMGAWHKERLIAYYGGMPRRFWHEGGPVETLQMGDVMVHPQWRGILTRRGPFYHVTQRFHASRLGPVGQGEFQLGFGFPNQRHLRLGVMLGLIHDGGTVEELYWKPLDPERLVHSRVMGWGWRWEALDPRDAGFDGKVGSAWKAMLADGQQLALGQRDAAYLRWRYVDRPGDAASTSGAPARYRFFVLRRPWSGAATGLAIMDLRGTSAHWLDWVGSIELMPLASRMCRLEAGRAGAGELKAWASAAVAQELAGTDVARRAVCAGLGVSVASALAPKELASLRWWLMGGDTDFL